MQIHGNYYSQANVTSQESKNQVEALASYMNSSEESKSKAVSDTVQLSSEAYAALKEYAPEALSALGYQDDNPVLDEMIDIAREKYFHFDQDYAKIPGTQEEMISALDVATRYMDALNSIEPEEINDIIANANAEGADSNIGMVDVYSARMYLTA